jgi:cytochrome c oxidase subunit II
MQVFRRLSRLTGAAMAALAAGAAHAQVPHPWQMGMQPAHSPVQSRIEQLNSLVLVIIVAITIFVAGLLAYVAWRYSEKRNPTASRLAHHSTLEAAWTIVPVLILVVIAIPSFRLVYYEDRARDPAMTVKVTGHQWYWEYTYPDANGMHFESYMVPEDQLKPGQLRNLEVDNPLVVPAGQKIRILTTSGDVIHSFFIPSLGVQRYAIPGRSIETWMEVDRPGDYYGECNQICGTGHSVMPIHVHAVTPAEFTAWLKQKQAKSSTAALASPTRLASTER